MPKIDVFLRGSLKNRRLMTKGGGGSKSRKIDDVFYECRLISGFEHFEHTKIRLHDVVVDFKRLNSVHESLNPRIALDKSATILVICYQ